MGASSCSMSWPHVSNEQEQRRGSSIRSLWIAGLEEVFGVLDTTISA